jgi:transposase
MTAYVGIDLHRRRSLAVCLDEGGKRLWWKRFDNSPQTLVGVVLEAGSDAVVVMEATWGWYWAVDVLADEGVEVHLAHPLGIKGFENRRVKNDLQDAEMLANLLRLGSLPESWIAPDSTRQLRELVRYRHKLCRLRTGLKSQLHSVLGKEGMIPPLRDIWGPLGAAYLDEISLGEAFEVRLESLRNLIAIHDTEIDELDRRIHRRLRDDAGYRTIQQLNGVGRVHAAAFVAEIGDVTRFPDPRRLCSWAGLTPRLRESDTKTFRGGITKQGSALVRWSAVEAVSRYHGGAPIRDSFHRIADRRGNNIAKVAAARKLLTLVFYGLRDHEIRCLHTNNDDMVEVA